MLPAGRDRSDVGRLQRGSDLVAGDGATGVVGIEDPGPESALAQAGDRQSGVAEHRPQVYVKCQ